MKTITFQLISRRIALFSALSILASIVNVSESNAAVRIGDKCKTMSQTVKNGSVKLICVKVDKSLQWINAPVSMSYAFGPAGRLQYRYINGKQERLSSKKQFVATDKRGTANFHPIRVAAYQSIRSLKSDATLSNINFEYIIQPNFPAEIAEVIKAQSATTASYLSPLLDKKLEVKLVLVTEKDKEFIGGQLNEIIPNPDWLGALRIIDDYGSIDSFYSRSGTGGGTAFYLQDRGYAYYLGHTSSLATLETYWPEVAPHEMAHVFQGVLSGGQNPSNQQFGEGHPQSKWTGHLIEGSANTLGMAIGFETLGWYSDEMDHLLRQDIKFFTSKVKMKTTADAINLINRIEKRSDDVSGSLSYSAGQFLWEYFVGKYGAPKLMELYKNIPLSDNFSTNIKETIGISKDQFYRDAAPYLLANWQRLS
jgi:hypothetical protein